MPRTSGTDDGESESSRSKCSRNETVEELLLPQVHHEFLLWEGCTRDAKSRYNTRLAQLLPRQIYSPCIVNYQICCDEEIDDMLRIRVREAKSKEEIFTSFDEVCDDDELQSKNIIKFRLGRRAHSLILLEFARRLGLYQAVELEEDGFNVYFEGGLRSDDNFNATDYWLSISREENLGLSRSHTSTIRNPILRVIYKMITYGLCQRMTGYDKAQKNDLCLLSMFDARHQNGYANVAWDLYDRMGRMEIHQDAIERMEYRQSYHWDRYHGVFEHMARVYSVPMQGAYNPPGYTQPQYDQYYQQYPPPPPQQQHDDDE
ncbi:hypothetical protein Tco_0111117 [Tanacetum coccineum]